MEIKYFNGGKTSKGDTMKHKETADEKAIKDASLLQRVVEKENFLEMEDPERYAQQRQLKKDGLGKTEKRRKKEARVDREKTEKFIAAFVKRRNTSAKK
jgi:hypothetical protein